MRTPTLSKTAEKNACNMVAGGVALSKPQATAARPTRQCVAMIGVSFGIPFSSGRSCSASCTHKEARGGDGYDSLSNGRWWPGGARGRAHLVRRPEHVLVAALHQRAPHLLDRPADLGREPRPLGVPGGARAGEHVLSSTPWHRAWTPVPTRMQHAPHPTRRPGTRQPAPTPNTASRRETCWQPRGALTGLGSRVEAGHAHLVRVHDQVRLRRLDVEQVVEEHLRPAPSAGSGRAPLTTRSLGGAVEDI